ncbi:MAG TPA: OsmC family protein [Acidimicrobiia bacterium]|nr:OsmC family protein [Acidimicrobiia bacterium]
MPQDRDLLGTDPRPPFFPIGNAPEIGLVAPEDRLGVPVRTWVRSLAGMQKEALVINGATGRAWRLVSDEGPYLDGHDRAPCPLCTFITGLVASYMNEITALAPARDIAISDAKLTVDTFYSMEGSALQGTMMGGAAAPRLVAQIASDADAEAVRRLVLDAVATSPATGLFKGVLNSRFNLSHNGDEITVGSVEALNAPIEPDPGQAFDLVEVADVATAENLMIRRKPADEVEGVPGGAGSSLQESQSRRLHVRAVCTVREDGVKEIVENLFSPIGSEFRFLSDEAPGFGGSGLAPDASTYLSAGLGFCFMTQFGRYARITKRRLDEYRIVQDTHFTPGAAGGRDVPARAEPVETHVYLVTPEEEDFSRRTLDMGEQTCFLHATCRTDLGIDVEVVSTESVSTD